jgi:hypothetical protein
MAQHSPDQRQARQRILTALDETVAQLTFQAARFQEKDAAAPILVTSEVVRWVERIHRALTRYGEGEYAEAARLADVNGVDQGDFTYETGDRVQLDLVAVIQQTWRQVWGVDERLWLCQWLDRNTTEPQVVAVDLAEVLVRPNRTSE